MNKKFKIKTSCSSNHFLHYELHTEHMFEMKHYELRSIEIRIFDIARWDEFYLYINRFKKKYKTNEI